MTRGKLVPLKLPWMISPSVSDLRVQIVENGDATISAEVAVLPQTDPLANALADSRVLLIFSSGQWVRTEPSFGDIEVIPPGMFERTLRFNTSHDFHDQIREFRQDWLSSGICPISNIYSVENSLWIREQNAARFGCQHYVIEGHDMWVELIAQSFQWRWDGASTADAINTETLV
jgi:hypothetical protein